MALLKQILKDRSDIELDLYGIIPPAQEWLLEGKIQYKGSIPQENLLEVLAGYDFGLVPYSFDLSTERMMSLSFPSKLIDYLGASLPLLVVAPPSLFFVKQVESKNIGIAITSLTSPSLASALDQIVKTDFGTYQNWQEHAHAWAKEEFLADPLRLEKALAR